MKSDEFQVSRFGEFTYTITYTKDNNTKECTGQCPYCEHCGKPSSLIPLGAILNGCCEESLYCADCIKAAYNSIQHSES